MQNRLIAVFRSRNDTQRYYYALRSAGVRCAVISTPLRVARACGISVSFASGDRSRAETVVNSGRYPTFVGFYKA